MCSSRFGRRYGEAANSESVVRRSVDGRLPILLRGPDSAELAIQVVGRADQREMSEGLRKVAELLAGGPDLLRVQPDVVRVGEHLFEGKATLIQAPGAGQRSTHQKEHSEKVASSPASPSGEAFTL